MSYVCLWSPAWPTGAAFDADLAPALLQCAPRVVVGDDNRIWVDARGLHAAQLALQLIDTVRGHGIAGVRAGTALTPIAAECAAVHTQSIVLKRDPATDAGFVERIARMLDVGLGDRLLLSHDRGWYDPAQPGGGQPKPFTYISETFLPKLRTAGLNEATLTNRNVSVPSGNATASRTAGVGVCGGVSAVAAWAGCAVAVGGV